MELRFFSVTAWGTSCVDELIGELRSLELIAEAWDFPYHIGVVVRCGKNTGKTFRRFNKATNDLTIDIRQEDSVYRFLSKNEQRERLGNLIFSYFVESINKYSEFADETQRHMLISKVEEWMIQDNWRNGKIEQARFMLQDNKNTFEVSRLLNLSLEEVEDILLRMYENDERTDVHPDNVKAGKKAMPI